MSRLRPSGYAGPGPLSLPAGQALSRATYRRLFSLAAALYRDSPPLLLPPSGTAKRRFRRFLAALVNALRWYR